MTQEIRVCAVVPTYNNPTTLETVVAAVREHLPVVVVDDGSSGAGAEAVSRVRAAGLATVVQRSTNGGKGAAVADGLVRAQALGFTHALQIDADGQHNVADIPRFVACAQRYPNALILGNPTFDASAPLGRRFGRKLSVFWVCVQTWSQAIDDPLCGYRVYPLVPSLAVIEKCGQRMDFDPEIAVRLAWHGTPITSLKTRVIYPPDGISHFRLVRDNLRITWMHSKLCMTAFGRVLRGQRIRGQRA